MGPERFHCQEMLVAFPGQELPGSLHQPPSTTLICLGLAQPSHLHSRLLWVVSNIGTRCRDQSYTYDVGNWAARKTSMIQWSSGASLQSGRTNAI